jgi:hypothetical protein
MTREIVLLRNGAMGDARTTDEAEVEVGNTEESEAEAGNAEEAEVGLGTWDAAELDAATAFVVISAMVELAVADFVATRAAPAVYTAGPGMT